MDLEKTGGVQTLKFLWSSVELLGKLTGQFDYLARNSSLLCLNIRFQRMDGEYRLLLYFPIAILSALPFG